MMMNFRILTATNKIIPAASYSEALEYKGKNGGTIYIKECSCVYNKKAI